MDIQKEREAFEAWLKSLNENGRTTYFLGQESTVAWEAWQAAKAQTDQKIKLLLCDEHLKKCESPTGIFNSQYPDEEPCLICLAKQYKAQAVPAQLDVNSILHDIDCYFDNGLSNTERTANNLLQSIYEKLSGEVKAQEPAND